MFHTWETAALRKALDEQPDLTRFAQWTIKSQIVGLQSSAETDRARPLEPAKFYPPDHIFGIADDACLNGVMQNRDIELGTAAVFEVPRCTIVGTTGMIDPSSVMITSIPKWKSPASVAESFNLNNAEGFVLRRNKNDNLTVSYLTTEHKVVWNKRVFFLRTLEAGNYGSFLIREMPQLLSLKNSGCKFDAYVVANRSIFLTQAIIALDLPQLPIFQADEVAGHTFEAVLAVESYDNEGFINKNVVNEMREMSRRFTDQRVMNSDSIYISRTLSSSRSPRYRPLLNENEVISKVSSLGFEIVFPETCSFSQQMATFGSARRIIGPSGSGMLNALFADDLARVVDLESYNLNVRQHARLYSASGKRYAFGFGYFDEEAEGGNSLRPWTLPLDVLDLCMEWLN